MKLGFEADERYAGAIYGVPATDGAGREEPERLGKTLHPLTASGQIKMFHIRGEEYVLAGLNGLPLATIVWGPP